MSLWSVVGTDISGASSAEEALELSGLDWEVKMIGIPSKMPFITDRVHQRPKFSSQAMVSAADEAEVVGNILCRTKDKQVLFVHGANYRPVQNRELFEIAYSLKQSQIAFPAEAGILRDRTVWIRLDVNEAPQKVGNFEVSQSVLIFNSHDDQTSFGFSVFEVADDEIVLGSVVKGYKKLTPASATTDQGVINTNVGVIQNVLAGPSSNLNGICHEHSRASEKMLQVDDVDRLAKKIGGLYTTALQSHIVSEIEPGSYASMWDAYLAVAKYLSLVRGANNEGNEANRLAALWFGDSSRGLYNLKSEYERALSL